MICPLMSAGYGTVETAQQISCMEECSWWDKFNKQCAILTIAKEVGVKK